MPSERFKRIEERSADTMRELSLHIGDLARGFSLLEEEVVYLFSLLVNHGDSEIGRVLAQRLTFSRLVDMIDDLASEKVKTETKDALAPFIRRLREMGKIRNESVHSSWGNLLNDDHTVSQWSATGRRRGELRRNANRVIEKLSSDATLVFKLTDDLSEFVSQNIWIRNSQPLPPPYSETVA